MQDPTKYLVFLSILFLTFSAKGNPNTDRREIVAVRAHTPPHIDGTLDDAAWENAPVATGFYQFEPHNDRPASFETYVRVLYDDNALYIGARMVDPEPGKILTELGLRDANDGINADQFWIDINPFDDGVNGFRFKVSSSGVQTDINISAAAGSRGDINWDAVWMSAVTIDDKGWVVEMKIPYSALRFPRNGVHQWGINFWREIRRTREQSSWNFVNRRIGNNMAFKGILKGIEGITPPVRLALFPYVSGYLEKNGGGDRWGSSSVAGMDLKYGINNSFTMDMTLIPDFGQVQSDARVLNLTPYEVKYDENRQFFTEGTELFSKADIFYSRRVGNRPRGYRSVYNEIATNEIVAENPLETRMINATKISGRTANGLGLGIFNAMTTASHAVLLDTISGEKRRITSQPFTNYSVIVLDQSIKNNSFLSFINTNVAGAESGYVANVTATDFRFNDASNVFRVSGNAALSQQYQTGEDSFGYKYDISAGKVGGNWQYSYNRKVLSNTYDPNDLGYLAHNNFVTDQVSISYNIFDPFWRLWNLRNEFSAAYNRLHDPDTFTGFNVGYNMRALFDTRFFLIARANYQPLGKRDYFEPRVAGRFYETDAAYDLFLLYSTDYRKRVYLDGDLSFGQIMSGYDQTQVGFELRPTFRVNDRLNMTYGFRYAGFTNDIGFTGIISQDSIQFGMRMTDTYINTVRASYIFSNNLSLKMNLRHYWSMVEYSGDYFLLKENGRLDSFEQTQSLPDINYNAFTVDMLLTWHFAPGSQLSLAWKNNIDSRVPNINRYYLENLRNTLDMPQVNSFSLKLLYYLDYQKAQNLFS
jgi:hypothetical protein